jgi:S1-C subfamily serine protease
MATARDLGVEGGALVGRVVTGSPADKAGLVARDVIVGVDGRTVKTMGALVVALRARRPGDSVALDVRRGHEQRRMTIHLVERPSKP